MPGGDSLVDVLLEFLEALIHQVLFIRQLYSPELFERQRLYGIAVRRSRHPELNAYIADAVAGLRVRLGG
jgi:mitotic spindle assembly checkpoint protein MAD2B